MLVSPYGANLIQNDGHIEAIATMGIILLMFLLGLHLHPTSLLRQLKQTLARDFLCITITSLLV